MTGVQTCALPIFKVFDLKHLNTILSQIKAKSVVTRVERVNG